VGGSFQGVDLSRGSAFPKRGCWIFQLYLKKKNILWSGGGGYVGGSFQGVDLSRGSAFPKRGCWIFQLYLKKKTFLVTF